MRYLLGTALAYRKGIDMDSKALDEAQKCTYFIELVKGDITRCTVYPI